ncbi:exodeoxyribonuclease VII large subunit [Chitinasiproducens palmae]|uniref:Exodeoxyribonuclease 7 large subunit n=1 Tax=Chitinasiproducens palmae TaxID=1770053 RepID=A0A1H2PRC8_9BURK|nr:exodeoxyribonuclease VII large subunit [Chitinasiproducens palmae]SDV49422.1 Exodeoxyribonuclease VII large subunit [Chitinasiproducens palmae]
MSDPQSADAQRVISVSELNRAIGVLLERSFPLCWVTGEVSNFTRAASGHWYFSIKDAQAQLRCVMFRNRAQYTDFRPREGDRIEVRALVSMYTPRGELQLNVEAIRRVGQGRLYELFLQMKQRLEAEGLFDAERKRALPSHPRAIGVVTSLQAAALRDVLSTLARRAPHVPIVVYPAPVQGVDAAPRLAAQLQAVAARRDVDRVDVIILCRGGGAIEDLWAFNEEVLARAVVDSPVPVVAGVGHETDFTIADFVADLRAPTPTAAAELVSPDRLALLGELDHRHSRLARAFGREIERRQQQVDWLSRRLVSPAERVARQRTHLQQLGARLGQATERTRMTARARLDLLSARLLHRRPQPQAARVAIDALAARAAQAFASAHAARQAQLRTLGASVALLSPRETLRRGYAAILDPNDGTALRAPRDFASGKRVSVLLADGALDVTLGAVQPRLDHDL